MEVYGIKDQSKYSESPKQTNELMGNVRTFKDDKSEILVTQKYIFHIKSEHSGKFE